MCMVEPTVKLVEYLYTQYGLEFHNEKEYEMEVDLDILDLETFEQDIKMAFNFNSGNNGGNADKLFSSF